MSHDLLGTAFLLVLAVTAWIGGYSAARWRHARQEAQDWRDLQEAWTTLRAHSQTLQAHGRALLEEAGYPDHAHR